MKHATLCLIVTCLTISSSEAQTILFRNYCHQPPVNIGSVNFHTLPATEVFAGRFYRLLQFDHIPDAQERRSMLTQGIELLEYIPHQTYIASLVDGIDPSILRDNGVKWVGQLSSEHKVHHWLMQNPYPDYVQSDRGIKVLLRFHRDVDYAAASRFLLLAGIEPSAEFPHADLMEAIVSEELIFKIADLPFIAFMDLASEPGEPESLKGQTLHRSNGINTATYGGLKYDGTGVSIAINDDGFVGPHIDVKGRTDQTNVLNDHTGSHGDMTAGIAAGAGNINPSIQGMAPGSFIWVRKYSSSLPNTVNLHTVNNVMVFSSSYGNGCNAGYTSTTQMVDQETYTYPELLQSFSAGNANGSNCGYGAGGQWGNITGGHKIAKNAIAVANLHQNEVLAGSSSHGPASDGRIKPDIASHGNYQTSLDPNNAYGGGSGTSAACPGITGVFAQLVHAHRDLNGGADAESGLLKACMLNSAHDLGNVGPDFKFGWGRVNAWRAYDILADGHYFNASIDQGGSNTHSITVPSGVDEVRVMLYWMDPAASTTASKALVNDLDMTLTDPSLNVNYPWVLNPTPDPALLDLPATNGVDTLNNMEQVALVDPVAGTYTLIVNGSEVPMGPQKYYVVYSFFSGVRLTYPIGGEGLDPGTTELLAWDAVGTVGTFDLAYSTNGGGSWTSIVNGVAGSLRQYDWVVPNTPSGDVLVRVKRGSDMDVSDEELSIMQTPVNLSLVSVCLNYMRISWDAVPSASNYSVHLLGAMYMDSVDQTSLTTYDFPIASQNDEQWFSVTAHGANGMRSRRAIAVQFSGGGLVNCSVDHDVSVASILTPGEHHITCNSLTTQVMVDLVNHGLNDESNIPIAYRLSDGAIINETYVPVLPAQSSVTYTFVAAITLNATGPNLLEVWTSLSGDLDVFSDTSVVDVKVITGLAASIPLTEDFESQTLCGTSTDCGSTNCPLNGSWRNLTNGVLDNIDWRVNEGPTSTGGTGPSVDVTTGSSNGKYVYLESSSGCSYMEAVLLSPCVDLSGVSAPKLTFNYHMRGSSMGSLHIDLFNDSGWTNNIIPAISGNQGNAWVPVVVDLSAYVGSTIALRIRGVTGPSYTSDIALDEIFIGEPPACAAPANIELVPYGSGGVNMAWTCSGCTGNYFVEYGAPGFAPGTGATAGGGTVLSTSSNSLFITGLAGCTTYDLYLRQDCGFDGFSLNSELQTFTAVGVLNTPYVENFDTFLSANGNVPCGGVDNIEGCWTNNRSDANDWTARSLATTSVDTGPDGDHTGGGNFLYLETSFPCNPNVSAGLYTPALDLSALMVPELVFWYHMYGETMGTMVVHASVNEGITFNPAPVWSLSADQGNQWMEAIVDLSAYAGETGLMLRWTGTSTTSHTGDMAIDDVQIHEMPTCPKPTLLLIDNVSGYSAQVSWVCNGCSGAMDLEYGPAGFIPGSGTFVSGVTSPYVITSLSSLTSYDIYARQDCGGGDVSGFSGLASFVTKPSCGDKFFDSGGSVGTYAANSNESLTFCPMVAGERVRLVFNSFDVEAGWDALYVFDGPDTSSPMIASANGAPGANNVFGVGAYWGNDVPGPFVSSDPSGCITVAFTSDGTVQNTGWDVSITCEPQTVTVGLRVMLEGPYNVDSLKMDDDLRSNLLLPNTEPYSALGFSGVYNCACAPVSTAVLTVVGNDAIVDWVLVELRSVGDPSTILTAVPALLQRDGDVVGRDGVSPVSIEAPYGDHYVAVRHRNHLGAMAAASMSLGYVSTAIDISDPATLTWGSNAQMNLGGVMMLRMGNVYNDGLLKYIGITNDRDPILVDVGGSVPTATATGYMSSDTNMDGTVKYIGSNNDRDPILVNVGGNIPTATRIEQLP